MIFLYIYFLFDFVCCFLYLQRVPITWSEENGLDTVVTGNGRMTLNFISRLHGVSIDHLSSLYPDLNVGIPIPAGKTIRFNKPKRWLSIAKWFADWEDWIRTHTELTRTEQNRLFITHQLHTDLQRTCHSMYNIIKHYVHGNPHRRWVPRRFSQDVLESFFSEIRQSGGGNTDTCREQVDRLVQRKRWKHIPTHDN